MTQSWPPGYTTPPNTWVMYPTVDATQPHNPVGCYTDLYWATGTYYNFDVFITPELDSSQGKFYAHQFWINSGDGGYLGIQSNGTVGDGTDPTKLAIFSIWNAIGARGGDWNGVFGGEGSGYTVRIHYPWVAGRQYRLRLWVDEISGGGQWWEASVKDMTTGVESTIGDIKVPLSWGTLTPSSIVWTEHFSGPPDIGCNIEATSLIIWSASGNADTVPVDSIHDHFTNPPTACGNARFTGVAGALTRQIEGLPLPDQPLVPPPLTPPPITPSESNNPTTSWWNANFPFRRRLKIAATEEDFPKTHPVLAEISAITTIKQGKIKLDLTNIVVIHALNNIWTPLSFQATIVDDTFISIIFDLVEDIPKGTTIDDRYYIYYGSLYEVPTVEPYTTQDWPVKIPYSNYHVSYTRPGEHWVNGVSKVRGAKATFRFAGTKIRLISNTGDYGVASVQLDDEGGWKEVDLFSYTPENEVEVYSKNIDVGIHTIRVVNSGRVNPSAGEPEINIVRFEYSKDIEAVDLGEEINDLTWISFSSGAQ